MRVFVAALLLCLAPLPAWSAPRERKVRVVQGLDGDPHLRIDLGRALSRSWLADSRTSRASAPRQWLRPIEKARLDARRIWESALSDTAKMRRLIAIVRIRFPHVSTAAERYQHRIDEARASGRPMSLSQSVADKVGLCRESAFLLVSLLRETPVSASVRYGELYTSKGNYEGGHAWVEAELKGKVMVLDAARESQPRIARLVTVRQTLPTGRARVVVGRETEDYLYVPTSDLRQLKDR